MCRLYWARFAGIYSLLDPLALSAWILSQQARGDLLGRGESYRRAAMWWFHGAMMALRRANRPCPGWPPRLDGKGYGDWSVPRLVVRRSCVTEAREKNYHKIGSPLL